MKYRISAGYVQIRKTVSPPAEFLDIVQDCHHILQGHLCESGMAAERVDVAMFATLITGFGDVQLKSKIIHDIEKWPPGFRGPFDSFLVP